MMRFASLGSGSKGNATVVQANDTLLLVDCGFPAKETERRLDRLGVHPEQIDAILVTHEHGDHASGVAVLSRQWQIPVFLSHGTAASGRITDVHSLVCIDADSQFQVGDIQCEAVAVPHDAREPVQYCLSYAEERLGILTDLGSITPHVVAAFGNCTGLLLESNHDLDMLLQGPYPAALKKRVAGDFGHLNNQQAAQLLATANTERLRQLVIGHISEQNNSLIRAQQSLGQVLSSLTANVVFACQSEGFSWLELSTRVKHAHCA